MIKIMRQRNCYQRSGWAIYRSLVKLCCPLRTPFILARGKKIVTSAAFVMNILLLLFSVLLGLVLVRLGWHLGTGRWPGVT